MRELGLPVRAAAIAAHYGGLLDALVVDGSDADDCDGLDVPVLVTRTLMRDLDDRCRLAGDVLALAARLHGTEVTA